MVLFKKKLFKGLYIAAKSIPAFSRHNAINSKLLKCAEIKTTLFFSLIISSKISFPSNVIYLLKFEFLKCFIKGYSASILP